jgi:hypothetical protein
LAFWQTRWIARFVGYPEDKDLILQDREVVAAALEIFRSRPALGVRDVQPDLQKILEKR